MNHGRTKAFARCRKRLYGAAVRVGNQELMLLYKAFYKAIVEDLFFFLGEDGIAELVVRDL